MKKIIEEYTKRNTKSEGVDNLYESDRGVLFKSIIGSGKNVLDLGCRHGSLTKYYIQGNKITGVDFDTENLKKLADTYGADTKFFDLNEDLTALGVGKWDAVVASEVLEHLYYPEHKTRQISQLLNKNGVFVGSVPNGFSLKNRIRYMLGKSEGTTMSEPTHITHFSYRTLKAMLGKHFEEVTIYPIQRKQYSFLTKLSPNLFGFMLAFSCKKPKNQ